MKKRFIYRGIKIEQYCDKVPYNESLWKIGIPDFIALLPSVKEAQYVINLYHDDKEAYEMRRDDR